MSPKNSIRVEQKLTIKLNIPGDISHKIRQYDSKIEETMDKINELRDDQEEDPTNETIEREIMLRKAFLKDLKQEMNKLKHHQSMHTEGTKSMLKLCKFVAKWF